MDGSIEIQDEGSQMIAVMGQRKPGEQVVDFCAGAGGQALALAASMNNKGRVSLPRMCWKNDWKKPS